MTTREILQFSSDALYLAIFVFTLAQAIRRPRRATVDTALFFADAALIVGQSLAAQFLKVASPLGLTIASQILLMALPYLLFRLVEDFAGAGLAVRIFAPAGLLLSIGVLLATLGKPPEWAILALVAYFVILAIYDAVAFLLEALRSRGVTRRRLLAVAAASGFLGLVIVFDGAGSLAPQWQMLWSGLSELAGFCSGLAYFTGFSPPKWVRRMWQEPELRRFLSVAARLPRLPDTDSIVRELERATAASLGTKMAALGLWDEAASVLSFKLTSSGGDKLTGAGVSANRETVEIVEASPDPEATIVGRAFATQKPVFFVDSGRGAPPVRPLFNLHSIRGALAAPITAGKERLGVLAAYSDRSIVFAEEDLDLLILLADQAAVVLESRRLIDQAAKVRAREEATRLKDDFLSSAAHDLKSPLTTLLAQGQLLERQARRDDGRVDVAGIERMVQETKRLRSLVNELLDASRTEQGRLLGARQRVNLAPLIRQICGSKHTALHRCQVEAPDELFGNFDAVRIAQLLDNLVENAIKYSPAGGEVAIKAWQEGAEVNLTVTDSGIGIPREDLPLVFERFHRATNVDDRHFAGMGLGLYICRGIVEQHGGHIWVTSSEGKGSTFHVQLPLLATEAAA